MKRQNAFLLTLFTCNAFANNSFLYKSGNQLHADFSETAAIYRVHVTGYVVGVVDARNGIVFPDSFCFDIPANIAPQQLADIAKQYLVTHPELRHYSAVSLVSAALSKPFPCAPSPSR